MTIFAVICAGIFPGIHVGRVWLIYWLFPHPEPDGACGRNFRSPLLWDVFAVSTYVTVSLLFWYMGMVPDLATLRDRADDQGRSRSSTASSRWAGAAATGTGTATRRPTCSSPPRHAAGALGALGRVVRLRRRRSCPAGTRRSSRPTSSPAPSSAASPWCVTLLIPARQLLRPARASSRMQAPREHEQDHPRDRHAWSATRTRIEFFIAWYSGNALRELHLHQPRLRPVLAGPTGHDHLQRASSRRSSGSRRRAPASWRHVRHRHRGQHRHVVRALRHHRHLAAPRLPAVELGHTSSRPGSTSARSSAASACSSRCSCCSCRFLPMVAMAEVKGVHAAGAADARRARAVSDEAGG